MNESGTMTLVELAMIIEGFATALAAVFALVGVAMVYVQMRGQRAIQREATAMSLFRQYLQQALERPEFVSPDHDELKKQGSDVQYEFFVANMLYSFDEVLQNTRSRDWREVVRGEVARHAKYLRSARFQKQRRYYAAEVVEIIDAISVDDALTSGDVKTFGAQSG